MIILIYNYIHSIDYEYKNIWKFSYFLFYINILKYPLKY